MSPVPYFRALQPLLFLLTLVIFFLQIVVWKKAQTVWGVRRWELGNVLVGSERLLEVKGADFYIMNLAVLL